MSINLYPHQKKALYNMKNGCILCGGVGSGKSITSISYYYLQNRGLMSSLNGEVYRPMKNPMDLYIITTARKRDQCEWEGELSPFLLSTHPDANAYSNKVVVDSWNNVGKYKDVTDAFFIFDEQRVVGKGAWVKAFLKICKSNKWILLSATPGDTWSDYVPVFIANGFFKNRTEFNNNHVVWSPYSKFPKIDRYFNTGKLMKYRNDILVQMEFVRSTVSHHEDVYVQYDIPAYKRIVKDRWNIWDNKPIVNASELCYSLRKIVNLSEDRQVAVLNILEKHPKAIIFYNFDYELELLHNILDANGFDVAEWNGHKHQPVPNSDKWVYFVQYAAGAEGWNCITTDTIIFYSQNYSYKVMIQSSGRIDRLNTPFTDLYYYHLKSRSGIDLAISKALKNKKKFNETGWVNKEGKT